MRTLCVLTIASLALGSCGSKTVVKGQAKAEEEGAKTPPGKQYEDAKQRVQQVQQQLDDRGEKILEASAPE